MMEYFTLFVVLPTKEVCSLRRLPSGTPVIEVRNRLEMTAGLPANIYKLTTNKGQLLHEDYEFVLGQNAWDGYIVKVQLQSRWQQLYEAVRGGDLQWLSKDEILQLSLDDVTESKDDQAVDLVEERGMVALYLACWMGSRKFCQELLSLGVNPNSRTPFRRSALFAAVAKDNDRTLELMLVNGTTPTLKDVSGDTALDVARRIFSRRCVNVLRSYQLRKASVRMMSAEGRFSLDSALSEGRTSPPDGGCRLRANKVISAAKDSNALSKRGTSYAFPSYRDIILKNTDDVNLSANPIHPSQEARPSADKSETSKIQPQLRIAILDSMGKPINTFAWDNSLESELLTVRPAFREGKFPMRPPLPSAFPQDFEPVTPSTTAIPWNRPDSGKSQSLESVHSNLLNGQRVQTCPEVNNVSDAKLPNNMADSPKSRIQKSAGSRKTIVSRASRSKALATAKKRIQLAEKQKRSLSASSKHSLTFDQWLHKKRLEESEWSDDLKEEDEESDRPGQEEREAAFQNWLKELKERPLKKFSHRSNSAYKRPGQGFIQIVGSNESRSPVDVDTSSYLRAYHEWKKLRKAALQEDSASLLNAVNDGHHFKTKRRDFLASAITYEEWMTNSLERHRQQNLERISSERKPDATSIDSQKLKNKNFQQCQKKQEEREQLQRAQRLRLRMEQSLTNQ